jgi:hypothetical protein
MVSVCFSDSSNPGFARASETNSAYSASAFCSSPELPHGSARCFWFVAAGPAAPAWNPPPMRLYSLHWLNFRLLIIHNFRAVLGYSVLPRYGSYWQ